MKKILTCHLVIKNNQQTIERALDSLLPLDCNLLVADVGCQDDTYKICRKYGAEIIRLSLDNDYSKVRNEIVAYSKTEWQLYIEPWEVLSGCENIILDEKAAYRFQYIQGDILAKTTRLWHKHLNIKFENPIYETLIYPAQDLNVIVLAGDIDRAQETLEIIKKWKERVPLAIEPYYYQSCVLLMQRNWDTYLQVADYYLFHEKKAIMPITMTRYYCALVQAYIKKDYRNAIRNLINCLVIKPLMAEFWCLLADVYYAQKEYEKAMVFYKNAILLGGRRLNTDEWPMEIPKYQSYPEKMIEGCRQVLENSQIIVGETPNN